MSPPDFDRRMLEALVCPQTQTTLRYDAERHARDAAERGARNRRLRRKGAGGHQTKVSGACGA